MKAKKKRKPAHLQAKETKTLIYSEVKIHRKKQKEMVEGCYSDKSNKPVKQNMKAIEKQRQKWMMILIKTTFNIQLLKN